MPSGKMIAWIVGLSLATTMALEHYRSKGETGPALRVRRAA